MDGMILYFVKYDYSEVMAHDFYPETGWVPEPEDILRHVTRPRLQVASFSNTEDSQLLSIDTSAGFCRCATKQVGHSISLIGEKSGDYGISQTEKTRLWHHS